MVEWRPIRGFEELYSVSDGGQVVRTSTRNGRPTWKPCKPTNRRGYHGFALCVENKVTWVSGHRAAWEAFHGPIPDRMEINHKNGIKHDNALSNLEVCSRSQNATHASRVLGRFRGNRQRDAVLSDEIVELIRDRYAKGKISQQQLADEYGVTQSTISKVVLHATWLHVR